MYRKGAVGPVSFDPMDNSYLAIVKGTYPYEVEIFIDEDDGLPQMFCTCPYDGACKHEVAVIQKLLKEGNLERNQKSKPKPAKKKKMALAYSNTWRKIPGLETTADIRKAINDQSGRIPYSYGSTKIDIEISQENIYTLSKEKSTFSYYDDDKAKPIQIKKEDGAIYVKCTSCLTRESKLCSHQSLLLNLDVIPFLTSIITDSLPKYNEVLAQIISTTGLREDQVKKYYKIGVSKDRVVYYTKAGEVYDATSYPSNHSFLPPSSDHLIKGIIEELDEFGYGFAWSSEGMDLITGKVNKTRTKLSSHIRIVNNEVIDNNYRRLYNDLEYFASCQDSIGFISCCKKNIELICSGINYQNTSNYDLRKSDLKILDVKQEFLKSRITFEQDGKILIVRLEFLAGEKVIKVEDIKGANEWMSISQRNEGYFFNDEKGSIFYSIFEASKGDIAIIQTEENLHLPIFDLLEKADEIVKEGFEKEILSGGTKELYVDKSGEYITFTPRLTYEKETFNILETSKVRNIATNTNVEVNQEELEKYTLELQQLFSEIGVDPWEHPMIIVPEKKIMSQNRFMKVLEYCGENDINLLGDEKVLFTKFTSKKPSVNISFSSGIDWFDSQVEIAYGDINVSASQWVEAVRENKNYVLLSDGKQGILPEKWIKKLKKLSEVGEVDKKGNIKISKLKFNVLDDMFEEIDDDALREEINEKKEALANYENNKSYRQPRGVQVKLRPYQKKGYQWLKFLEEFNFGGCLADDMGLGKTLQVLTLLLDQKRQKKGTSLIIVPRSLLFNWRAEIEKFTPALKAHIHHGPQRNLETVAIDKLDLIITTYDTCVKDIELFSNIEFNYIVLDESQAIKNPNSQRYKAMRLLKSDHRLVMTGTPIENNTMDLYAQFSFINPGLLGSSTSFKNKYANKIDAQNDADSVETLKKLIHPFILRRKKENVAKDLPQKTESILYCEMDKVQRSMYEELKNKIKADINSSIEKEGVNKSKFKILDGLLRLRQMCNATQLTSKNLPKAKRKSVKIDTLMSQLEDIKSHNALVFSQFVGMLSLVRERLDKAGIKYAYLDGSTRDRQKAVNDFMKDDDCKLFLISIKAGNSGLNLTKADYVYIIDPWWNPAVESQAIDRTHRIGQDKPIFAYKMICKGTIEEKIIELQTKKKKLANDLIQVDENVFKSLDKKDLMALFD